MNRILRIVFLDLFCRLNIEFRLLSVRTTKQIRLFTTQSLQITQHIVRNCVCLEVIPHEQDPPVDGDRNCHLCFLKFKNQIYGKLKRTYSNLDSR